MFVAGLVAYWAEGTKTKPWRSVSMVQFVNSDPDLVRLFLRWLRVVGVPSERLVFRVLIHESADVGAAQRFWSDVAETRPSSFQKTTLKRHNPKTVRRNLGDRYYGSLVVTVRRSSELNLRIEGWCQGLARAGSV